MKMRIINIHEDRCAYISMRLAILYLNLTYNNIYISFGLGFLYSPHTRNSDADATTTNMEELLKLAPLLLAAIHNNNNNNNNDDNDGDNV
jgi:hypothetical protein